MKTNREPQQMEVIINGVRYVPAEACPDEVRVYYMHDNHTFTRLHGNTLDDLLDHADRVESSKQGSFGMLCPADLLRNGKAVRRVGPCVYARGSKEPKDYWNDQKVKWRMAMEKDAGVMRSLGQEIGP